MTDTTVRLVRKADVIKEARTVKRMRELEMIIRYERIGDSDMHNYRKVGELVRCKDCKWYHEEDFSCEYWENAYGQTELYPKITPFDFCSRSKRKDEDNALV